MSAINIQIKSSTDKPFTLTIEPTSTILQVKQLITAKLNVQVQDQRLIYSGKVLKDTDTVEAVKLVEGITIHLVRSIKRDVASPSATSTPASTPTAAAATPTIPAAAQPFSQQPNQPFNMFSPQQQASQLPDLSAMQNNPMFNQMMSQMLQDPNMMQQMMNQSGTSLNPRMMEMMNSPQFRAAMSNPQVIQSIMSLAQSGMGGDLGGMMGGMGAPGAGGMGALGILKTKFRKCSHESGTDEFAFWDAKYQSIICSSIESLFTKSK